jgi:hypothetical protein
MGAVYSSEMLVGFYQTTRYYGPEFYIVHYQSFENFSSKETMFVFCDVKVKLCACLTNVWGSGRIDPQFLDLGTSRRCVVSFTPLPLYPPGERAVATHWIGGWVDSKAGLDDLEKRKFLILPGIELRSLDRPVRNQYAIPASFL